MDLPHCLREAIQPSHVRIEALPLSRALIGGTVRRSDYVRLLAQLYRVHELLESALAERADLKAFYQPDMARAAVAARDLVALGAQADDPWPATARLLDRIDDWGRHPEGSWALLGCLYVLEGSRMGSMLLVAPLSTALVVPLLPNVGLDYHRDGMADRPRRWQAFRQKLAALSPTPAECDGAVHAAVATMNALEAIYSAAPLDTEALPEPAQTLGAVAHENAPV